MRQEPAVGDLDRSIGYVLKQTSVALRSSMEAVLRPLDLSVPQYSCLEQLGRSPGLSNADLARKAFVTRQSMSAVLRGLQKRGLLDRPATAVSGRSRPTRLTSDGRVLLKSASIAVARVERNMLSSFSADARDRLLDDLVSCVAALAYADDAE